MEEGVDWCLTPRENSGAMSEDESPLDEGLERERGSVKAHHGSEKEVERSCTLTSSNW